MAVAITLDGQIVEGVDSNTIPSLARAGKVERIVMDLCKAEATFKLTLAGWDRIKVSYIDAETMQRIIIRKFPLIDKEAI